MLELLQRFDPRGSGSFSQSFSEVSWSSGGAVGGAEVTALCRPVRFFTPNQDVQFDAAASRSNNKSEMLRTRLAENKEGTMKK